MEDTQAFRPMYTPTVGTAQGSLVASVTHTVGGTATTVTLPGIGQSGKTTIRITNVGASACYVNFGNSASVAAATVAASFPIAAASPYLDVTVDGEVTSISAISATTGSLVYTRGSGI